MKVIGITGGMASGKSTVAKMMAEKGFPHLDADQLVHHLMATDSETIAAIGEAFPGALVNGMISRAELSRYIGQDSHALATLEALLHPRVRAAEQAAIAQARADGKAAVILDIPLLFETGADALCDVVVSVEAPPEIRRARAFERPAMSAIKWDRLMARQLTDEQRRDRAAHAIQTDGSEEQTRAQVDALLKTWNLV